MKWGTNLAFVFLSLLLCSASVPDFLNVEEADIYKKNEASISAAYGNELEVRMSQLINKYQLTVPEQDSIRQWVAEGVVRKLVCTHQYPTDNVARNLALQRIAQRNDAKVYSWLLLAGKQIATYDFRRLIRAKEAYQMSSTQYDSLFKKAISVQLNLDIDANYDSRSAERATFKSVLTPVQFEKFMDEKYAADVKTKTADAMQLVKEYDLGFGFDSTKMERNFYSYFLGKETIGYIHFNNQQSKNEALAEWEKKANLVIKRANEISESKKTVTLNIFW